MLTIKCQLGQDIRRKTIATPQNWEEFRKAFEAAFGPLSPNSKIRFTDDEDDLVVLGNQSDYEEALRVVANSDPQILRLTVTTDVKIATAPVSAPPRCCPAFASPSSNPLGPLAALLEMGKASLPDLLANPALRSMAEGLLQTNALKIVQPFVCDCCNANIAGDRFHSSTNPNFDLCKSCFETNKGSALNNEHQFVRVSALEALIATLSNGGSFDAFFAPGAACPEPVVRHNAICDACNQPIAGIRHKCLDRADFDLCNVCFLRPNNPQTEGYVFYAIQEPNGSIPETVKVQHAAMRDAERRERALREAEEREAAQRAAEAAARAEAAQRAAEAAAKAAEEEAARARKVEEAAAKAREEAERKAREASLLTKLQAPPAAAVPIPSAPVEEPVPSSAFERNLETLASMGFSDRKRNIQVLVRNRNKLFESIQELL